MKFAGVGKRIAQGTPSMVKGFFGLATPVKTLKRMGAYGGAIGKGVMLGDQKQVALNSMKLLGTAAGVTYGVRALRGQALFRNKRGQRDFVPFVPFV